MRSVEILEVREESKKIKSIFFPFTKEVSPGQFFMIGLPSFGEIPLSVSFFNGESASVSVSRVGRVTEKLHTLKNGDFVTVRGPYGNGFSLEGDQMAIIAGGCGVAPLVFLAEAAKRENKKVHSLVGVGSKDELVFRDRFEDAGDLHIATNDGSLGHKGFVTEMLDAILKQEEIDQVYTCGPEKMMAGVLEFCTRKKLPLQASLERHMKCGVGLCGACLINGLSVCKDGPVFDDKVLKGLREFGAWKRDSCGTKLKI